MDEPQSLPEQFEDLTDTGKLFKLIDENVENYSNIDYEHLKKFLGPIVNPNINDPPAEESLYHLLDALDETDAFKEKIQKLDDDQRKFINDFLQDGKINEDASFDPVTRPSNPAQEHFSDIAPNAPPKLSSRVPATAAAPAISMPRLFSDSQNKSEILIKVKNDFHNWGLTVRNTPQFTCYPTTVHGVQEIVKFAALSKLRIRVAGLRHSWSPTFSDDGAILLSLLRPYTWALGTTNPEDMKDQSIYATLDSPSELNTIELKDDLPTGNKLCRVGAAVVSERFRKWQMENKWTLPVDTILIEVTIGGAVQGLCHGAGRQHKTITDQVRRIEYIDCRGNLQTIDDPRLIKAAAGSYGLLGVVTHVWFELRKMIWPTMKPYKTDVALTVPPPALSYIPSYLKPTKNVEGQVEDARKKFSDTATNHYYSEWFWAPQQQQGWVHTWDTDGCNIEKGAQDYPGKAGVNIQWLSGILGSIVTGILNQVPEKIHSSIMGSMEMLALPKSNIKTQLPNALHYRRGVQEMRALNLEFQIPLPARADDPTKPDMALASKVWWDVINICYKIYNKDGSWPMKLLLEMRIMGGSDMILAPQYGNTLGTASIGVLSVPSDEAENGWMAFLQEVVDAWFKTCGDANIRPHLMKEWYGLKFKGVEATKYLREVAYKDQIAQWKSVATEIGKQQGWTLDDLKKTFSNKMWDELMFT